MGTQGPGRKRLPNQEKMTAEDDALQQIARDAEARLAARRTARAEAREIRMKELEKQHKEKYYGLDYKWGRIEQWMEDGERYSRHSRRIASLSDDEERMSVGSRGSLKVTTLHQSIPGSSSSSSLLSHIFSFTSPFWHTSLSHLLSSFYPCTCSSFLPSQPSDYSSFLGSGSRASSRTSSARASPVVEERLDRDFLDRGSRTALNLSAATLSSLGGASSRRGSCDTSVSVEMEASIREMKDSVAEAEEKYRRAMVSNAQLHNDKSTLMYQVETLREDLSDMEELLWEARRHADERTKAYERERDCHILLQFQFKEMNETMRRSEELLMEVSQLREQTHAYAQEVSDLQEALQWKEKKIAALERQREISDVIQIERDQLRVEVLSLRDVVKQKYGEVISPELATNGGPRLDDEVSNSFAENVPDSRESMLELHLKKLLEERESLQDQVRMLKTQLLLRQRNLDGSQNPEEDGLENGADSHAVDLQRDASRQIGELKFKLVKSEQEVTALEQNVIRLEAQVTRYRTASENAEMVEDELKVERRKLHRELRTALDRIQELESANSHLTKRLEKMKANRSILLAQQ
ncbi:leucine-rich repeat flightless-interacting protein 2 isoform X10 [Syngnathus scovelli]|uniref:leucine-rich repeat flightless-interacting protein 2 isoform X10 n=1 Tax=Syngnathus scovelli TaxID=161590 RepID=UPI00211040E8|nr:leucine-rich repeat flightless-interacting protein 2 isoform X11 [Syngnathus scovelli]